MTTPPLDKLRIEESRSVMSQVMDELMGGSSPYPAETSAEQSTSKSTPVMSTSQATASTSVPAPATSPAQPIPANSENFGKIYAHHPAPCGNERWMKNAGIFKTCMKVGKEVCPTCGLIEYCSEKCRFEHLDTHAVFCNPPYASERWAPDLSSIKKAPEGGVRIRANPGVWGNIPASDMLSGEDPAVYSEDVNILLPISGDLRNTIVTVNALPSTYAKTCDVTLNDPSPQIVIRNALILMTLFIIPSKHEAVQSALQLWYSAFLSTHAFKKLKFELLPFITRAYDKSNQNGKGKPTSQISKRWTKGNASLRLTLTRRQWKGMMEMLERGDEVEMRGAVRARREVLDVDKAVRNKVLFEMPHVHRRSHMRYLMTGILLPFGQPVGEFDVPNPTLFSLDGKYLNTADNTPLDAWYLDEVLAAGKKFSVLEHDIYHALCQNIGQALFQFSLRLSESNLNVNFHLYCVETKKLDGTLGNNKAHHLNGLNFLQMGSYDGDYIVVKDL